MENEKPKNFKDAAVSHIPQSIVDSMMKQANVDTSGASGILEAISKLTPNASPLPIQKSEIPNQSQFITIAIDNVAIKVPTDPFQGAMTLFCYLLATVWSKDKRIAKVLKSFSFSFSDVNGQIIYPKQKRKNEKTK